MKQRNPDMEAYRDWKSDRNDRGALQRYVSSMDREREVLDDPERIVELDDAVGQDNVLRPIYFRVRPDYSDKKTPFKENRWHELVSHYSGRRIDPRAVLILVEMGLRSGVSTGDVYQLLRDERLISNEIFANISFVFGSNDQNTICECAITLGQIGASAAPAVPVLINALNNRNNYVRSSCIQALGKIGQAASSAVHQLIYFIRINHPALRSCCVEALGSIGPGARSAVPQLMSCARFDSDNNFRYKCRIAIEKITGERPS